MNTCIVVPSINPAPPALERLRRIAPDALMIVVGDLKAPPELREYCKRIDAHYLGVEEQKALPYKSMNEIPWNCIMRRNLGLLEAMRAGADVVISADDDNSPRSDDWLQQFEDAFAERERTAIDSETGWLNLGDWAEDSFFYRGYPYSLRGQGFKITTYTSNMRVGIANGLIYGDPDINATERIEKAPNVTTYVYEALDGFIIDPRRTWSPINTQNTAYSRECIPLSFVLPHVGRYDDIWASYIAQAVMAASARAVHFGPPEVTQERNPHNVYRDLSNELMGMEYTEVFCETLKNAPIDSGGSVLDNLAIIAEHLRAEWVQPFPHSFLSAWIEDCWWAL